MCKGIEDMLRDELEEGRAEGRADMIVNMYDAGLSLELICSIAKESMETICSWLTVAGRSIPTEK